MQGEGDTRRQGLNLGLAGPEVHPSTLCHSECRAQTGPLCPLVATGLG